MKRWKFSLESIRQLKNRLEEDAAQKHARALIQVSRAKALLAETEKEFNAAALMQFAGKGKKATDFAKLAQYLTVLEKQRRERLEKVLHAERDATLARASLEKVAREREILDRLRDRKHAAHQFHVARQEQAFIDEMAQQMKRGLLSAV